MFPRPGVQMHYTELGEKDILCDDKLPLMLNSLTINCVRGSSSVPTAKTW